MSEGKTLRWDFILKWSAMASGGNDEETEDAKGLIDRFMIALHRFQTEGRIEYRRICGMHAGGGGTSCKDFKKLLQEKVDKDILAHYRQKGEKSIPKYEDIWPDGYQWPEPSPNCPFPEKLMKEKEAFAYTFCWHGKTQFLVWHRPYMIEFERGLQKYDPKVFANDYDRYHGAGALGVPYWAWETWDGLTLPYQFTTPDYFVQSSKFEGWAQGIKFDNPLFRWFAPVSLNEQVGEYFPPSLTDSNCTTRSQAFTDMNIPHIKPWLLRAKGDNKSILEVVNHSLNESKFSCFASTEKGLNCSIEHAHNKLHNHIGGVYYGGIQGAGHSPNFVKPLLELLDLDSDLKKKLEEKFKIEFTGTMATNQSTFDPIFWLHHSNVERQLVSWQNIWYPNKGDMPEQKVLDTVLYPWTKPSEVEKGQFSWNTPSSPETDATFNDWWTATLPYEYDRYLTPAPLLQPRSNLSFKSGPGISPEAESEFERLKTGLNASYVQLASFAQSFKKKTKLEAQLAKGVRGGEFTVYYTDESGKSSFVSEISLLNSWGSGCARCAQKAQGFSIGFEVSDFIPSDKRFEEVKKGLSLQRNNQDIPVSDWIFSEF